MKKALMLFAEGFETVEALMVVDILRRGGVEVTMTSITEEESVKSAQNITVEMDATMGEVDLAEYDAVILPGGMPGTLHLKEHKGLADLLCKFNEKGKRIAAICAAPTVFGALGLLKEKAACCYPGMEEQLNCKEAKFCSFVTDGNITTSRGVGTAIPFALELIRQLFGNEKASEIAESIVYKE